MSAANLAAQFLLVLSLLSALAWLWHAVAALRGLPSLPDLTLIDPDSLPSLPAGDSPDLTVIVPACNEEKSIQATLRSLLASTGLRLQIVAVNDRSTDRTGELMHQVAAEAETNRSPHSLHALRITELPPGWLGKPHAMALAAQQATAPWLLFTDGDVIFHPQALSLALRHAQAETADCLVLVPTLTIKTLGETVMLAVMNVLGGWTIRLWKVADPRARDFIGVGGFNLIRREVYERLGGFETLRMEVLDDMRLGWLVKRAGYRQRVALGPGLVRIRWLQGALGVIHLAEKNGFAALRYRVDLMLLACLGVAAQIVVPLVAIAAGGWAMAAGMLTYASIAIAYWANRKVTPASPWQAIFFAPAASVVLYAGLRSMVLALVRNGVDWRGTHYSLDELRRHAGRGW